MKTVKKDDFYNGKKIKGITHTPVFILSLQGYFAAKHNPDKIVERLNNNLHRNEAIECMSAEVILEHTRNAAAEALGNISIAKNTSAPAGAPPSASAKEKRAAAERETASETILGQGRQAAADIKRFNQEIIEVDIILLERLLATRNKAFAKVNAFVYGVRKRIPDYSHDISSVEAYCEAYKIYKDKNREIDEAVKQ